MIPLARVCSPRSSSPLFLHCLDTSHGSSTDVVVFRAPRGFKTPRNKTVVHPRSDRSEIWRSFSSSTHACSTALVVPKLRLFSLGKLAFLFGSFCTWRDALHTPTTQAHHRRSHAQGTMALELVSARPAPTVGVRLLVPSRSSRNRRTRQNGRSGVRWHFAMRAFRFREQFGRWRVWRDFCAPSRRGFGGHVLVAGRASDRGSGRLRGGASSVTPRRERAARRIARVAHRPFFPDLG